MARIFFVFLALMCLSACGGGRTEDGAPPQEIPLEQDYNPSEQDVQTLEEEEAPSGLEASEAEPVRWRGGQRSGAGCPVRSRRDSALPVGGPVRKRGTGGDEKRSDGARFEDHCWQP